MNVLLAVAALIVASAAEVPDASLGAVDAAIVRVVEDALRSDAELLENHCGYRAFLDANPQMASAEEAFVSLAVITSFRVRAAAFDEALANDPRAETLFNRYADALNRDHSLLRAVDAVFRDVIGLVRSAAIAESVRHMLAHVDIAIEWLDWPSPNRRAPDGLDPLAAALRRDPDRRRVLCDDLSALHENPLAHTHIFPWWQAVGKDDVVGRHYAVFLENLLKHGARFWTWHRREIVLAAQPHARDWLRYWRRRVRRAPELARRYDCYLQFLVDDPEREYPARRRLCGEGVSGGLAKGWPPESKPPALEPLTTPAESLARPEATDLAPKRPDRPSTARPVMPTMPAMPTTPEKPDKPPKPERGDAPAIDSSLTP